MLTLVVDSSCVIDLHKVGLLDALFRLPYNIVMPQSLLDGEIVRFADNEKQRLIELGLQPRNLDSAGLKQAETYYDRYPALAWNDCLALRMAEEIDASILMTGDGLLRRVASRLAVCVHGVIWALDEMDRLSVVEKVQLAKAIQSLLDDPLVFLPDHELEYRLQRLCQKT